MRYDFFHSYVSNLERMKALDKLQNQASKSVTDDVDLDEEDEKKTQGEHGKKKSDSYSIESVHEDIDLVVDSI